MKKLKKKTRTKYKKGKCQFIYPENHKRYGKPCKRNAIGKGTLCGKHGGIPDIDSMLPTTTNLEITKYEPSYHCVQAIKLGLTGHSITEIAAKFGISLRGLQMWTEKYLDFYEAMEVAKTLNETWWLEKGKNNLTNLRFQTPLYKFLTGNILGYSDKIESKNMNMNVHGVLMVPGKMTDEEWEQEAEENIKGKD